MHFSALFPLLACNISRRVLKGVPNFQCDIDRGYMAMIFTAVLIYSRKWYKSTHILLSQLKKYLPSNHLKASIG